MGLTIHYSLRSSASSIASARAIVKKFRTRAKQLPFEDVGEIIEAQGQDCDFERAEKASGKRWLLVQSARLVQAADDPNQYLRAIPTDALAFTIRVGAGCEPANLGLCRYPQTVESQGRSIRTGLKGWGWASFCKTQYSSDPGFGGVKNFLKCHLSLIILLDYAKEIGVLDEVKDEGGYWEDRNVEKLVKEIGSWNEMVAGYYGQLRDAIEAQGKDPRELKAPISSYPNFEHLEARGRKKRRAQ